MRIAPVITLVALSFTLAGACAKSQTEVTPEGMTQGSSTSSTAAGGPTANASSSGSGGSAPTCQGPLCSDASNCGRQGHSCLGGACSGGACQPLQVAGGFAANQLALDATTIYGAINAPRVSQCVSGARIESALRESGAVTTIVPCGTVAGEGDNAYSLLLSGGSLYWSAIQDVNDPAPYELHSVVAGQAGAPTDLGVWDLAIWPAADAAHLYISKGGLSTVDANGANLTNLDARSPIFIALDDATVYFLYAPCYQSDEDDGCDTPASILSIPKTGGVATTLVDGLEDVGYLSVHGAYLYWIQGLNHDSTIRRVSVSGGPPETVISDDGIDLYVADDSNVYWRRSGMSTSSEAYDVMTASLSAPMSARLVLHQDDDRMLSMTADDTAVVWSSAWGKLWLVAK